ncbi:Suppressor of tumorigenicity 7 protein [Fukomys damarensis]|uniref:Suppressor of tumorigenicity 7 protein n=1 Tax=Fukomys damarensis TaxID=885580 RepID=A0A091EFW4_FUKDA|nr:Suppressor of tumorigenicity 7 protein [Fukomys damarensis]
MAEAATGFLEQLKSCIVWSWTYLWTVWFFIVLFLVYILRVPLKINDNLSTAPGASGSSSTVGLCSVPDVIQRMHKPWYCLTATAGLKIAVFAVAAAPSPTPAAT